MKYPTEWTRTIPLNQSDVGRLRSRLRANPATGCLEWTGCKNRKGYGNIRIGGQTYLTHRVAWAAHCGQIPDGMHLDHVCKNPACCNPQHLRVVTPRQNALENSDSVSAHYVKRTHCKNGHEFTPENTHWIGPLRSKRRCRKCNAESEMRRRSSKRKEASVTT